MSTGLRSRPSLNVYTDVFYTVHDYAILVITRMAATHRNHTFTVGRPATRCLITALHREDSKETRCSSVAEDLVSSRLVRDLNSRRPST